MGKRGPCYHCGVTSTPLWRNGPPEKPVLCNACGSRWRTKGTLVNYTPLHARAEPDDFEDYRVSKVKTISLKNRDAKSFKRKYDNNSTEFGGVPLDYNHGFRKRLLDEDTSNRSSSGSAMSNSESCAQYGNADASELTGSSQPIIVWDTVVPSRKRTCVTRPKSSPVEKLTKDLYTIWHEQQSSCFPGSSKEELLLESDKPMVSVEIGHGSVLIRHPSSIALEEQSEGSSLSIDNKQYTVISRQMTFPGLVEDTVVNSSFQELQKIDKLASQGMERERFGRDRDQLEELLILAHHNSPLCYIGLQDVLNSDKFSNHLTNDEQKQLLKFLPSIDTLEGPDSLKRMFGSPQFKENLLSFQKLLADGVFDISFSGVNTDDCRILKKFVLCNLTKSKWVEQYKTLENLKGKNCVKSPEIERRPIAASNDYSLSVQRSQDGQQPKSSGAKAVLKSPQRIMIKSSNDQKELIDKNGFFFSARSLVSSQNDVLDSSHIADESPEQDMLLDLPSNSSFPQAELLSISSFSSKYYY